MLCYMVNRYSVFLISPLTYPHLLEYSQKQLMNRGNNRYFKIEVILTVHRR